MNNAIKEKDKITGNLKNKKQFGRCDSFGIEEYPLDPAESG